MVNYIIEHLEPKLFEWCEIEYRHISRIVGKKNLWFTNIKNSIDREKLKRFGRVFSKSIREIKPENACVLDPEAEKPLKPSDKFNCYIFGGILGDNPPRKRTRKELTRFLKNYESRNLGKGQMSTDNAVFCVKQIAEKGKRLSGLKFVNNISIKINRFESVELPYKYNIVNSKPLIDKKIIAYLKRKI